MNAPVIQLAIFGIIALVALIVTIVVINFAHVWVRAWSAGAPVGIIEQIGRAHV